MVNFYFTNVTFFLKTFQLSTFELTLSLPSNFKFRAVDLEIVVNVVTKFVHTKPAREEKKYLLGVSGSILRINPPVVTR